MPIEKKLKGILIDISESEISSDDIKVSSDLNLDFGFNSIDFVELIVEIETTFDLEFDDEDMDIDKLVVFGPLVELIESKMV